MQTLHCKDIFMDAENLCRRCICPKILGCGCHTVRLVPAFVFVFVFVFVLVLVCTCVCICFVFAFAFLLPEMHLSKDIAHL